VSVTRDMTGLRSTRSVRLDSPSQRGGVLQGLRRMKFEDVYGRWQERRLSQAEAAEILGMSERTFRRWRDRYDAQGLEGLLDHRLGRPRPSGCRSTGCTTC